MIADKALKTLSRHLWYLSDLTVPLALYSEKVDRDTKARMFRREDDESKKLEKPKFPSRATVHSSSPSSAWTTTGCRPPWRSGTRVMPSTVLGGLLGLPRPPTMLQREL